MNRRLIQSLCLLAAAIGCDTSALGQSSQAGMQQWIRQLGADSYRSRTTAQGKLIEFALSSESAAQTVLSTLSQSEEIDLETSLAKQDVSRAIEESYRQKRLNQFAINSSMRADFLHGWSTFSSFAGQETDSRVLYTQILARFPRFDVAIDGPQTHWTQRIDPKSITSNDVVVWSMLLTRELAAPREKSDLGRCRLISALRVPGGGPGIGGHRYDAVMNRLVSHFLESATIGSHDRLVIGAKYDCHEITHRECQRVLESTQQRPSTIVTAMLVASAKHHSSYFVEPSIQRFLGDTRECTLRLRPERTKSGYRVQVRDVAQALQLHRSGLDPRSFGFSKLQADPVLVFDPQSLGFKTARAREACHAKAKLAVD